MAIFLNPGSGPIPAFRLSQTAGLRQHFKLMPLRMHALLLEHASHDFRAHGVARAWADLLFPNPGSRHKAPKVERAGGAAIVLGLYKAFIRLSTNEILEQGPKEQLGGGLVRCTCPAGSKLALVL